MTTLDATVSAAQTGLVAPAGAPVRFRDRSRAFWRLLIHGAVWLLLTLGIYRFWLTTDIRRHLWSSTELAGESFEYIGTARELLLGFLIAIAILLPLNVALFIVTLSLGEFGEIAAIVLSFVLLGVLGQYAVYRARRYRLTRTVYRGLRFHQTGSAWRYAVCAIFWWSLIVLTLGLAYPFAQARLERFKMRHTFFGNLQGRFEGSGSKLFAGVFVLWLIVVVPFACCNRSGRSGHRLERVGRHGGRRRRSIELARCQRARRSRRLCGIDRHLAAAVVCRPLPHFPGHDAALVGRRVALRRRHGEIASADRASLRRLCPLCLVCTPVHARCRRGVGVGWFGLEKAHGRARYDGR